MKNKMTGLIVGGLITVSALGLGFGATSVSSAAAKTEQAPAPSMMQNSQMSPDMMNSPEMQKQCGEMMISPEMQKNMKEMMSQPQMQTMMKKMMASDPEFKKMMSEIVNNADDENTDEEEQTPSNSKDVAPIDHNAHHLVK